AMGFAGQRVILDHERRGVREFLCLIEPLDQIDLLSRSPAGKERGAPHQQHGRARQRSERGPEAVPGQRRRSFTAARVSRSVSRRLMVSRLSCAFLPLANEIATFTWPFWKYIRVG